jgi:glycosyltransferase involved in cell wall biosynthesis
MPQDRLKIAFVVQRYGAEVTGGSESLARAVAERLAHDYDITVVTTCARDYVTWRNDLPGGETTASGVRILRFPVAQERELGAFNAYGEPLYARPHTAEEEETWLRLQGPYAPALIDHLAQNQGQYAAVCFFTYLYYPTVAGLRVAGEHSLLIPTAHDEPPLRFGMYEQVFTTPRAFAFCSGPEEALVRERFPKASARSAVTGIGVDVPSRVDAEAFKIRHDIERPYVLYAGRIDAGKGCAEMLSSFERYRSAERGAADLLLIGRLAMPEPHQPGVRHLGFLSEEEKYAAMAGARAIICPSPYESLSIVLLEGFALGTPALASALSPVLVDHCVRSQGGLFYSTSAEFHEALDLIVRRPALGAALGANGRRYVEQNYRWSVVLDRYRQLIDAVARD